jgi:hypothetical protein
MKRDNQLISYKYKPGLDTSYTATFTDTPPYPNPQFILDAERKQVKSAYVKPAASFSTSYTDTYNQKMGSKLVGDPTHPNLFDTPIKSSNKVSQEQLKLVESSYK